MSYTDNELALMQRHGGKLLRKGTEEVIDFGWIPPEDYTPEMSNAVIAAQSKMRPFKIEGKSLASDVGKAYHWEAWKDSRVLQATGGRVFTGFHQFTGSCVGVGGGNAAFTLAAIEVARLNQPEEALVPFWPLTYGLSRKLSGISGRGEGSTGTGWAEAATTGGVLQSGLPGLPPIQPGTDGMLDVGASNELTWSNGSAIAGSWLERARNNLIKTAARIRTADEMRDTIVNGFSATWCGNWGGLMQCSVQGTPRRLMNRRSGSWSHQQSCIGWEDHPELGEIYCVLNQWGNAHGGQCPSGATLGSYWIKKAEMEWQCRNGECYAFSQFNGFPALNWKISWVV